MNNSPKRDAELFVELLQVPFDQRDSYLTRACGDDDALRQRLRKLLEANDKLGDFLDKPVQVSGNARAAVSIGEKPGDLIGRYKLLEQIGEGGCGVVFMAEQRGPVRRRVALKVIKPGMDTKNVIARFEAERQALALMDHPNIARIFDAGATESGRSYFVMELVRGMKITEYCDQHSLTTEERLKLFVQVCQAVQHAHQKGIIHRDIKPSNILVTTTAAGAPLPVVIDFGVAKATNNQKLTDKTLFTAFEMLVGTPAYMSPEQATLASADVDTRTDIYSLGVLLYELLTSSTPFETEELQKIGLDEMRRKIREQEPVRPSTRLTKMREVELSTVAKRRGSEAPALIRLVRGDLDWIVMKALEKDRTRRYVTADSLSRDVQHFLANEPVSARPPSSAYKFQKMVMRNKFLFLGMGLIIVLFIASFIVVSMSLAREQQAHRETILALQQAETEKNQATSEAAKSRQVTQFLEDMLQGVGPEKARGRDTTMLLEILDQTDKRIATGLTNQPEVEAEMRNLIGSLYWDLGKYNRAEKSQRAAVAIDRKVFGPESKELATSLHELSMALNSEGKLAEAESAELEALAIRRRAFDEQSSEVSDSLNHLASMYTDERRFAEAESLCREALATRKKIYTENSLKVADSLHALSVLLVDENKKAESEAAAREELAIREKILGTNDLYAEYALYDVAWAAYSNGKTAEAESLEVDDLNIRRKLLGDLHPGVASSLSFLGQMMAQRGQFTKSEVVLNAAYSIQCKLEGPDSPDALYALDAIGVTFNNESKWKEAEAVFNKSFAEWRKLQGNTGPRTLYALQGLVTALVAQKKYNEADQLLADVLTPAFLKDPASAELATPLHELSVALGKEGMLAKAEGAELEALAIRRHVLGEQSSEVSDSLNNLASLYTDERRFAEAESLCREALTTRKKIFGEYSPPVADSLHALSVVLGGENKKDECEAAAREELAIREKILGTNDVSVAYAFYDVAWAADSNGKTAEAESFGLDGLKMQRKLLGDLHPDVATSLALLGQIMGHRGQLTESEVVLTAAYSIQCKLQGPDSPDALYALDAIGMTLNNEGKWKEAEAVYDKSLAEWRKQQGNTGPRALWVSQGLVTALVAQQKYSDADQLLAEVLTPAFLKDPACADILAYQEDLMARQGRWSEALSDASLVVTYQPTDYYRWHTLATLLAINRNRAAYETSCPKILAMFAKTTNPYIDERVAEDCLFLPNSGADLNLVDKLADKAVSFGNGWSDEPYFQVAKAMSAYRLGHFTEAIAWGQKTLKGPIIYPNAHAYAIMAMAYWQLGQKDLARTMLDKGNSLTPDISRSDKRVDLGDSWTAWLEARISLDEANALIQPPETQARMIK